MCGLGVITRLCTNKKRVSHASTSTTPTTAKPRAIHIRAFESHRRDPPPACARATAPAPSRRRAAMHAPFLHHIPPLIARIRSVRRDRRREYSAPMARMTSRERHRRCGDPTRRAIVHGDRERDDGDRDAATRMRAMKSPSRRAIWAYLWTVSSDRAAKCRASRARLRFVRRRTKGDGVAGNHVVCAYGIELVVGKSTRNFYRDTRSRAPGENLCV